MQEENIPIKEGCINIIANSHTSFIAYSNCKNGIVITIKPPTILKERYNIYEPIWLTYFPQGYKNAYSPDRFEFEVMDKIVKFLEGGGNCVLIDCVEYLAMNLGKKKVYELVRRIKRIKDGVTIIIGINGNLEDWSGLGDYTYEERIKVLSPRIEIVDKIKEDNEKMIIGLKEGENRINLEEYRDIERFLFEGLDRIIRCGKKSVGIECTDYLLTTADERLLFNFFKDLIDIVVYGGGKIEVKKDEKVYSSPILILFDNTGLEGDGIFVGRADEIKKLRDLLNLKNKKMMLISGEVGIGKTSLVMQFKNYAVMRGFDFLFSRCYYESNEPYLPILDAFSKYVGGLKSDGFMPEDKKSFEAQRNAMFYEFTEKIKKLVKERKMVVFFDDIHWMDYSSLRLLHYLVSNLKNENIIFIGAYRPAEASKELKEVLVKMMRDNLYEEIKLSGLKYDELRELLKHIIGNNIPDKFIKLIYEKSGGNPLFAKELVIHLKSKGILNVEKMEYPDEIDIELPVLIKEIVNRRVSKLTKEERKIVEIASVIGYKIEPEILFKVSNTDDIKLFEIMERIESEGILKEDELGERYIFTERILKDGIYEKISKIRRKILHRKIAEVIETIHKGDARYYSELARHYKMCGDYEKAYEYYLKAGEEAEKIYAHEDAIYFYKCSLNKEIDDDKKISVYEKLGEIHEIIGDFDIAATYYFEALKRVKGEKEAEVKMKIGNLYERLGKYEHAMKYYENALNLTSENSLLRARVYNLIGWIKYRRGKYDLAIETVKRAIDIIKDRDKKELSFSFHLLGTIYTETGKYELALDFLNKAIALREEIGDLRELTASYNNIGIIYYYIGKLDEALKYYEKYLKITSEIKNRYGMTLAYNNIGIIYDRRGELNKALKYYKKAIEISKKIGFRYGLGLSLSNAGSVYLNMGNINKALKCYKDSLEIFKNMGNQWNIAGIYNGLSSLYMELGDYNKAIEYLNEATEITNKIGAKDLLCDCFILLSKAYSLQGDYERGFEYGKKVLCLAEELNSETDVMEAYHVLGIASREKGDFEKGEEYLKKAMEISKRLNLIGEYATNLYELGLLYLKKGDEKWMKILEESLSIFEKNGFSLYVEKIKNLLKNNK
ncbi:MAG: tetratricopeptide repeat protein [Euryarchaeota archaeon]|nr:tetratricopeptide repeat protein [Euryarchaeota archaeon]